MPPKNILGKGLGAILPDLLDDINEIPSFLRCGVEELIPNRFQPRKDFNDEEHRILVDSIRKNGILQPVVVRLLEEGYEIIAGERRWRAAKEAGLTEIPILIRNAEDVEVAELSLIENIQRSALNALEEAEAYRTLMEFFGLTQEEISLKVGKDRSTIANTLRLLKLDDRIKRELIEKRITQGHARALLTLGSREDQLDALEVILKKKLSVRETERLVQKSPDKPRKSLPEDEISHLRNLEQVLASRLKTSVNIRQGRKKGRIEIQYTSHEERDRLLALLNPPEESR
ncbi:MAG: putative chromosome-partitioning protein ParB [Syntrophus sp. PtaB.Bin075]|nr:MAG: putative chromosome-partitioning protein ParB [Syntrophus sp. PtaB.Bin075]